MNKSAVEWAINEIRNNWYDYEYGDADMNDLIKQAKEMEKKEKLERQLFIGKVSEIIGFDKTLELLKESKHEIEKP